MAGNMALEGMLTLSNFIGAYNIILYSRKFGGLADQPAICQNITQAETLKRQYT